VNPSLDRAPHPRFGNTGMIVAPGWVQPVSGIDGGTGQVKNVGCLGDLLEGRLVNGASSTSARFDTMCKEAEREQVYQRRAGRRCARHDRFHSLAGVLVTVVVGSTLFGSLLAGALSTFMTWVAGILVLLSAACTGTNAVCAFPERKARHEAAANRLGAFSTSCKMAMARFQDGHIDDHQFDALATQHTVDMQLLTQNLPDTDPIRREDE
jgi:hypothetical protein